MKNVLIKIISFTIGLIILLIIYQGYSYIKINDKNLKLNNNKISVELPSFYGISINDTMLATYLLKIGYFQFDKNITYDGVFNKNWLPLSYNFCNSKLGSDLYNIDTDFDRDGLSGINDKYPFDYSNGNPNIRSSETEDFDRDGLPNGIDMDADGNDIPDIYQAICFDGMNNKGIEQRKLFLGNEGNKFITNKEEYKQKIKDYLLSKIPNQEIKDTEGFDQGIDYIYNRLLYNNDIIYSIDGKNYYINRNDLINNNPNNIELNNQ